MPSKVLFSPIKSDDRGTFGHCAPKLQSLATVNELKIIIFVLNYLTVLVTLKQLFIEVEVAGTEAARRLGKYYHQPPTLTGG